MLFGTFLFYRIYFQAMCEGKCVGVIVSKLDNHRGIFRGYIAMLAVDKEYRKLGIGKNFLND